MLYQLKREADERKSLQPLPFLDLGGLQKLEKDLEELLARHLFEVLFEDSALMPIFQERQGQPEADIYALNRHGDLMIFELKRGIAGTGAMQQILRYAQDAGRWAFNDLEKKYKSYSGAEKPLQEAHKEDFDLDVPLITSQFNQRQQFIIIGNAANDDLINVVDYWKMKGLTVDFVPYRIYEIGKEQYFEFFSLPYDRHHNPAEVKGVLFDTNRSWDENSVWEMMEKSRVAAYGGAKYQIEYLNPKDIVFFSHKWVGIIATAEVTSIMKEDGPEQNYRDVKFLTPIPKRENGIERWMPFNDVSKITGKSFYWAATRKVPYLTRDEAMLLLGELNDVLSVE